MLTLKVCIIGEREAQEVVISHHLKSINAEHPGQTYLRVALDDFQVEGPHGRHQCLVFPALGMSLTNLRDLFDEKALEKTLLQRLLLVILTALDFTHQAGIVNTGPYLLSALGRGLTEERARLIAQLISWSALTAPRCQRLSKLSWPSHHHVKY